MCAFLGQGREVTSKAKKLHPKQVVSAFNQHQQHNQMMRVMQMRMKSRHGKSHANFARLWRNVDLQVNSEETARPESLDGEGNQPPGANPD
jgi:hypothetical protein